jgi:hypothetical protein
MAISSILVPTGIAPSVSLPALSLVDGTATTGLVRVHSLGAYLLRRPVRMSVPLDPASAAATNRTERLYLVRQYLFRPLFWLSSLTFLTGAFVFVAGNDSDGSFPWWLIAPLAVAAIADELFESYVARSAIAPHPRREKGGVRISGIPESVAREIVRRHPEISLIG